MTDILFVLKDNQVICTKLDEETIYLKQGFFKLGGYENFYSYQTANEYIVKLTEPKDLI